MKYSQMIKGTSLISQASKLLCALALLGAFSTSAFAGPITGEISYGFLLTPEDGSGNEVALGSATFLDFFDPAFLFDATGDFDGISSISLTDFAIDPFVAPQRIWEAGGFMFDLNSLVIVEQTDSFLNIEGYGVAYGNGFDVTDGAWTLTSTNAGGNLFSFTSNTAVPEPGPLALFGLGLIGIGLVRHRKRKA